MRALKLRTDLILKCSDIQYICYENKASQLTTI